MKQVARMSEATCGITSREILHQPNRRSRISLFSSGLLACFTARSSSAICFGRGRRKTQTHHSSHLCEGQKCTPCWTKQSLRADLVIFTAHCIAVSNHAVRPFRTKNGHFFSQRGTSYATKRNFTPLAEPPPSCAKMK